MNYNQHDDINVALFEEEHEINLECAINEFLKSNNIEICDLQYLVLADENRTYGRALSCLILYKYSEKEINYKVKLFQMTHKKPLEDRINRFLNEEVGNLIFIKYQNAIIKSNMKISSRVDYIFSSLILYKSGEVKSKRKLKEL